MRTFKKHLREEMKDVKFAKIFNEEKERIQRMVKNAREKDKPGVSPSELTLDGPHSKYKAGRKN